MKKFLELRIAIIPLLFGAFNDALQKAIDIEEVSFKSIQFALLIAFATILLIFLLARRMDLLKMQLIGTILFVLFLISMASYIFIFETRTFMFEGDEGQNQRLLRGVNYTPLADSLAKVSQSQDPQDLLIKYYGGPPGNSKMWFYDELVNSKMMIITTYSLMIISFCAFVSFILEFATLHYLKKKDEGKVKVGNSGEPVDEGKVEIVEKPKEDDKQPAAGRDSIKDISTNKGGITLIVTGGRVNMKTGEKNTKTKDEVKRRTVRKKRVDGSSGDTSK